MRHKMPYIKYGSSPFHSKKPGMYDESTI